jgi:hypothetical protein
MSMCFRIAIIVSISIMRIVWFMTVGFSFLTFLSPPPPPLQPTLPSPKILIPGSLTQTLGLSNWLINAFNGEWLRTEKALPMERIGAGSRLR